MMRLLSDGCQNSIVKFRNNTAMPTGDSDDADVQCVTVDEGTRYH